MSEMKADSYIESYLKLRRMKEEMKVRHAAELQPIDAAMEKIEALLHLTMQSVGTKSLPTTKGTAYLSTLTSATVEDWDSFIAFVKEEDAWEFLEHRANKSTVEQYKAEFSQLPPGVNWNERIRVNVKAS